MNEDWDREPKHLGISSELNGWESSMKAIWERKNFIDGKWPNQIDLRRNEMREGRKWIFERENKRWIQVMEWWLVKTKGVTYNIYEISQTNGEWGIFSLHSWRSYWRAMIDYEWFPS